MDARPALRAPALALALLASACSSLPASGPGTSPAATMGAIPSATAVASGVSASPRLGPAAVGVQVVASGLEAPWAVDLTPDNRLFVTERPGRVRVIFFGQGGGLRPEPWATLNVSAQTGAERGLLGIAIDPDFARNGFVYIYYSYAVGGGSQNRLVRMRDDNGRGVEETILLDNIPGGSIHDGGRVKFGPDGKLYVTTGDAGNSANAQDMRSLGGKILRLEKDGKVPADNPTAGSPVYSFGHRNVEGIAWHPDTKALYQTEHGPSGVFPECCHDEVNLIVAGANYGWPTVRGIARDARFRDPLLESGGTDTWAPAGAAFATRPGPFRGSFLFATLRGVHLHRVVFGPDGRTVAFEERLLENRFGRLRDVYELPSGEFLVLTSNRDGRGDPARDDDRILLVTLR